MSDEARAWIKAWSGENCWRWDCSYFTLLTLSAWLVAASKLRIIIFIIRDAGVPRLIFIFSCCWLLGRECWWWWWCWWWGQWQVSNDLQIICLSPISQCYPDHHHRILHAILEFLNISCLVINLAPLLQHCLTLIWNKNCHQKMNLKCILHHLISRAQTFIFHIQKQAVALKAKTIFVLMIDSRFCGCKKWGY